MSIKEIASQKLPEMIKNRRHMHMHPEVSFKEKETYQFILNHLQQYPELKIRENVGANEVGGLRDLFVWRRPGERVEAQAC